MAHTALIAVPYIFFRVLPIGHIAHQSLLRPVIQSKTKDTPHIITTMKNNIFVANLIG